MQIRPRLLLAMLALALPTLATAQTTYTWQNSTLTWGDSAAWDPATVPNSLADAVAAFGNVTTANSPNIDTGTFAVRGLTFDNTGGDWNLTGASSGLLSVGKDGISWSGGGASTISASLRIASNQTWGLGSTAVTVSGPLNGYGTITKNGSGTLTLTNANNLFTGAITVSEGTLTIGTSTSNTGNAPLRNTAVTLSSGATLGVSGTSDLRVGQISGSGGTASSGSGTINMLALSDATFSGTVTAGGLNLRGTATQTFNGDSTGLGGTIGINSGATFALAGYGDSSSGVLGSTGVIALRGGTMVLDNSGGNTSATAGRVSDSNGVTSLGGRLSFVGHSSGSSETLGGLTVNAGNTRINVKSNSTSAATTLTFATFTHANAAGVNFTNTGGILGDSGNNPRILFSTAPTVTNGLMIGASSRVGVAIVNGTNFATYDSTNGVQAVADSSLTTFGTFGSTLNTLLSGSGNTGGSSSNQSVNTITIDPSDSGQSLDINGTGNLNFGAILYRGSRTDYTISSSGGGILGGGASRTIWVTDANGRLNISASIVNQPVFKSGDGFLNLTNTANSASANAVAINAGTLRIVNDLNNSTSSLLGGLLTLRGGVLEISNGSDGTGSSADFTRSLGTSGATVNWNESGTDRGDGGFSAVGSNATVSIGGASPTALTWDSGRFVLNGYALVFGSTESDSRLRLMNNISLGTSATNYFAREIRVIDNANTAGDYASLAGVISGASTVDLLKTGAGTLELTANNTYAGNTLIRGGELRVSEQTGSNSGTGTGNVIVMSGGILSGTGRALPGSGNAITVFDGGTIRGDSNAGAGTLTVGTTVIQNGGSIFANLGSVTAGEGTSSKLALGANTLDLKTGSVLKLDDVTGFSSSTAGTFKIATLDSGDNILADGVGSRSTDYDFGTYIHGTTPTESGTMKFAFASGFTLNNGDKLTLRRQGNDLVLSFTPVPEPASLLAVCGLAAGGFALVRRLRRKAVPADVTPAA